MKAQVIGLTIIVMASLIFPETLAQVGISTDNRTPDNSAMLDVSSTSKGFLPPRMTQAQIGEIESPADGLMVYCTTDSKIYTFVSAVNAWREVNYGVGLISPPFTCGMLISKYHVVGSVAPVNKTVTYETVNGIPGDPTICWITSNLGADHQADSVNDPTEASAGWYWQFNRKQGFKHDGTTFTPNITWITSINENSDWLIANDPCVLLLDSSWRLPTLTEWTNVDASGGWTNWNGPWNSALKMHAAGYLSGSSGTLNNRGSMGNYWSSIQNNNDGGYRLYIDVNVCVVNINYKGQAFSSRCLRDNASNEWTCGDPITINHWAGNVAPVNKTVTYGTVNNIPGETSKCWITSNLGADHQATAVDDNTEASAGWYWQFNRQQGYKHTGSARTPNTTWITYINENSNWLTANDPCTLLLGSGWRLPTSTEWTNIDANGDWTNWNGPWSSALKMHSAGLLNASDGSLSNRGSNGNYWSSSKNDNFYSWFLYFYSSYCIKSYDSKALGFSARCLRD